MMKSLSIVALVYFLSFFVQVQMNDEMNQMTRILRNNCMKDTGVTEDAIIATEKGIFADDEKLKCYTKCVYVSLGVFSEEDSSFELDDLLSMIPEEKRALFEDMMKKCMPLSGNSDCEKTFNLNKCMYKQAPEMYKAI